MPTYFTTVDEKELERLRQVDNFMDCLYAAGVDNWEGWEIACALESGEMTEDDI